MERHRLRVPAHAGVTRHSLAHALQRAPLVWYFVLAIGLTWAWWLPLALTGRIVDEGWRPTHLPGQFGPMLAAVVITMATVGHSGGRDLLARMARWRIAPRWWLAAFSPLVFFLVAAPLVRLFGGDWPAWSELDQFGGAPAIGVLGVWVILVLTTGFGEETGWRGYAIPRLQRSHSPLVASLILSIFWILWHIPAFAFNKTYRDMGVAAYPGFFLGIAAGAVVLTWLYNRSGSSILAVSVWHGTYDLVSGTKAVEGDIAAFVSTFIMVQAMLLVILEVRAGRRGATSVLGPGVTAGPATRPRAGKPFGLAFQNLAVNPLVRGILRSPAHPLLSRHLLLITITGRRTGRRYTVPVQFQYARNGDEVYILPGMPTRKIWWRNLTGGATVTLHIRGADYSGDGEALRGEAARAIRGAFAGTSLERAAAVPDVVVVRVRNVRPLAEQAAG